MVRSEVYLHAKFHLDPSHRLATIHQRYRQDRPGLGGTDGQRSHSIGRITNGHPIKQQLIFQNVWTAVRKHRNQEGLGTQKNNCCLSPAGATLHKTILVNGQVTIIFVVSVCLFVCLFVCAEFFSAVFDPISIKLGHMLYISGSSCVPRI